MNTFIPSKEVLESTITEAVEKAVTQRLPQIIKKATQKEYYNIEEVCAALNVSKRHLQYLRDSGQIGYVKSGRKIYFKAEDLQEFFDKNYISAESEN